jgi:hypothetical protein
VFISMTLPEHAICRSALLAHHACHSSVQVLPPLNCSVPRRTNQSSPYALCYACYTQTPLDLHQEAETVPPETTSTELLHNYLGYFIFSLSE